MSSSSSTGKSWRLIGLSVLVFAISGVLTSGLQGEFESLIRHGLFSDKCKKNSNNNNESSTAAQSKSRNTNNKNSNDEFSASSSSVLRTSTSTSSDSNSKQKDTEKEEEHGAPGCPAQKAALTQSISAITSLIYLLALPMGIINDLLGYKKVALGSTVLWTLAASCSGLFPQFGWIWVICTCLCAATGTAIFLAAISGFLPKFAKGDFDIIHKFSSIITSVWDMSGLLGVALGYYLQVKGISLGWIFFTYGAGVGIPCCIFVGILVFKGDNDDDGGEESSQNTTTEKPKPLDGATVVVGVSARVSKNDDEKEEKQEEEEVPRSTWNMVQGVLKTSFFWLLLLDATWLVTFSYYVLANVEAMFRVKGGAGDDITWARVALVFAVAGCGFLGFLPGKVVASLGPQLGIPVLLVFRALLSTMFLLLVQFGGIGSQFAALFVMGVWRLLGFSLIEGACIGHYVEEFSPIIGTVLGLIWTPAGAASLGVGGWATFLSNQDPSNFTWIAVAMAGASTVASLFFAIVYGCWGKPSSSSSNTEAEEGTGDDDTAAGERHALLNA